MKIESHWTIPVGHTELTDVELERQYLLDKLKFLKENNCPNVSNKKGNTTISGYQPDYDLFRDYENPAMKSIYEKIVEPLSKNYWDQFRKETVDVPENSRLVHKAWLVEYSPGTFQNIHMHRTSLFTGVWTILCDEQEPGHGEFHIHNPVMASYTLGFYSTIKKIVTKKDDIYIVPSWLAHSVTPASAPRIVFVWDSIVIPN